MASSTVGGTLTAAGRICSVSSGLASSRIMTGRLSVLAATILLTASCASSTTTPTNASLTLHAEVTDPSGDAVAAAGVPTSPDLIHGTVDVGGGNLTVTIQCAPGTLSPNTLLTILLDTDQNPATGIAGTGMGIDYL